MPNTTDNAYFGDIATEISRRGALKAAGVVALAAKVGDKVAAGQTLAQVTDENSME